LVVALVAFLELRSVLDFWWEFYNMENEERVAAWRRHYEAKGANHKKAKRCVDDKRRKSTWPPLT